MLVTHIKILFFSGYLNRIYGNVNAVRTFAYSSLRRNSNYVAPYFNLWSVYKGIDR